MTVAVHMYIYFVNNFFCNTWVFLWGMGGVCSRAMMELDEAITSQRRAGRHADAQALFDTSVALVSDDGALSKVPWRCVEQRASLFTPSLAGVPFPFEKSQHYPDRQPPPQHPTAAALEAHFPAIQQEFTAMLLEINGAAQNNGNKGGGGNHGGTGAGTSTDDGEDAADQYTLQGTADFVGMTGLDVGLIADKNSSGWQVFELSRKGEWNERQCSMMPTVCTLLKHDKAVSGRLSWETVNAHNKVRGGGRWKSN